MSSRIEIKELVEAAVQVRQRAYAPYSKFQVGAALLTQHGEVFQGCNVENAAFGLCLCAERVAISTALAAGFTSFNALVVAAHPIATPCGSCRQFIAEFVNEDFLVVSVDADDTSKERRWSMKELLPDRFILDK